MADKRPRLTDLQAGANFIPRHIGPRESEISALAAPSISLLVFRSFSFFFFLLKIKGIRN